MPSKFRPISATLTKMTRRTLDALPGIAEPASEVTASKVVPDTTDKWAPTVRELLLQVWLEQACRRPADRPDVQARLLDTLAPLVDEAVIALAELFADGAPDEPALAVWRTFSRLDREHCPELAKLLIEAHGSMRSAP